METSFGVVDIFEDAFELSSIGWSRHYQVHEASQLVRRPSMKVKIKSWKGVALWSWDVPKEEVCGICRASFDGTCPTCKYPGDECPLVVGECTHRFHMHCIVKWLEVEASKNLCPMCRRRFETKGATESNDINYGGSAGSVNINAPSSGDISEPISTFQQ